MKCQNYWNILKQNEMKLTPKRKAIISFLHEEWKYYTPTEIWEELKKEFSKLGLPTVYRILQQLQQIGVVGQLLSNDNQFYYYLCPDPKDHHHHHFICTNCRKVECLHYCDFSNISETVQRDLGGEAINHFMQIEGLCADCLKKGKI